MHSDRDYKKCLDSPVFRLENKKKLAPASPSHYLFIKMFISSMVKKKVLIDCPVLRSEYHKFSARASRSHYMIGEMCILFIFMVTASRLYHTPVQVFIFSISVYLMFFSGDIKVSFVRVFPTVTFYSTNKITSRGRMHL